MSLLVVLGATLSWSVKRTGTEKALGREAASPREDQVALASVPGWPALRVNLAADVKFQTGSTEMNVWPAH